MRWLVLSIAALLAGCAVPPHWHASDYLQPDLVTARNIPLYLKTSELLVIAPKIMRYIDAVQGFLELHEPYVRRSRVVVYPRKRLFWRQPGDRFSGAVSFVRLRGPQELKIEWHPRRGAWAYARARLQEAGWSDARLSKRQKFVRRASETGERAIRAIDYRGAHEK